MTPDEPRQAPDSAIAAVRGACPRCGVGRLFKGWVEFAPRCAHCGLDFTQFNVGDGPAAFLILIVGALLTTGALLLDAATAPPPWIHLVWIPIGLALTVGGLRTGKALLLAQEYRHKAREGRIVQ